MLGACWNDEGPVLMVNGHTERLVEANRSRIRSIHVQHADPKPAISKAYEASTRQRSAMPLSHLVWVNSDDVDLAERRIVRVSRMHLCPTEGNRRTFHRIHEESGCIEPESRQSAS